MFFCWWHLCLCVVWHTESDSWRAEIPHSMVGLDGSCVVIPCHFSYPGPIRKASDLTGIWITDSNEKVFHSVTSKISNVFQGRTSLTGDLSHRNCSLKINPLHHSDNGPFTFRIEIEDYGKYSFTQSKVFISIKDSPAHPTLSAGTEMRSGKKVTTSCSVSHSCPSDPPHITWNHPGTLNSQSQEQIKGQWKMTSSLSFTASKMDHNKPLICTAVFPGGKKVTNQTTLNVKYPPDIVEVISESSVREGDSVDLNCSSNGNPAVHAYQWLTSSGTLLSEERTFTLQRVSRHDEAPYCTAINTEGRASSRPAQLNVVYPPEIKVGSSCTSEISVVMCLCMVDSHPASDIRWWGPDPSTELRSSSTERHGSLTVVTLQGTLGFSDTVHCSASNSEGNSTLTLHVPHNGQLLYISLAVCALVVTITGLSIWILKRKCNRTGQNTADPKTEMNTAPFQVDSQRKCKDPPPNYKEVQHVYGNMTFDEEDHPYECATGADTIYANI
ncbi:B-cell receptor CD22 isoform X2 [Brachyhypopomus gauderio]|uniref:B-cell receptor CD22 isoform X2 n=1 Tax=Brachyhypopomus gauderio TaxID=698409 RepID=UPI00404336E3